MKNLFQKEFLHSLASDMDFAYHNLHRREELTACFSRLKSDIPFSQRLNDWIKKWYEQHQDIFVFTDFDDFDSSNIKQTLQNHIQRFKTTGKIFIWTGSSENSIFGSEQMNHFFRAWHDHTHITYQCGFDFAGEAMVASIQGSMLPADFVLEKELIMIDIVGLNEYYKIHRVFAKDQRQFTIDYLQNPAKAIFTKQN